jgi:hypothetical protein
LVVVTHPDQIASFAGEKPVGNSVVGLAGDHVLASRRGRDPDF